MKMIRTVCTGLASVLLVSTYAAGQDPACCDGPPGPCCALAEGDSCDEAGPYRLSLPIEGFSEEAQEAFSTALLGIERPIYECAGHPQTLSEKAGTCADCGGAKLVERRIPAIASIGIQILNADQTALLELTPGETVRLSQITAALKGSPVTLELEGLLIDDGTTLHVSGLTCGTCSNKLQTALAGMSAIGSATCTYGTPEESLAHLAFESPAGMSYGSLNKAVADSGFRLTDLSWTGTGAVGAEPPVRYDLGITGFAKRLGVESELLIHGLMAGGPAEKAGLREGDRILTINGHVAFEFSRDELAEVFGVPEPVKLEIQRDGKTFELDVTPEAVASKTTKKAVKKKGGLKRVDPKERSIGLMVGDLAPEIDGEDLDGIPFKLSDYRGKVVVLSYWGFW